MYMYNYDWKINVLLVQQDESAIDTILIMKVLDIEVALVWSKVFLLNKLSLNYEVVFTLELLYSNSQWDIWIKYTSSIPKVAVHCFQSLYLTISGLMF